MNPDPDPGGAAVAPLDPQRQIEAIAARWQGEFDNHRQVEANLAWGGAPVPELGRERRRQTVHRLEAPQLGAVLLYFQEFRAGVPGLAHRQRLVRLVWDALRQCVRAEQLFFADGPTYDRPPLAPEAVARLEPQAFVRHPGCDLFFRQEPQLDRWRGAMLPGACRYRHPEDGEVCAEYEMLLPPDQLWYRDRSLRVADGSVRGEIDGFSWLRFDRRDARTGSAPALPALARQQGVWRGSFRRYDAGGELVERFASTIVIRIFEREGRWLYRQSNHYRWPDGSEQAFDAEGEFRDGRVWFRTERFEGWVMDLGDGADGAALLRMEPRQSGGLGVLELIRCSADGQRRWRCSQSCADGVLVRSTLIEEEKVSDDWRAWEAGQRSHG